MRFSTLIICALALVAVQLVVASVPVCAQFENGVWRPAAGPDGGEITALVAAVDGSIIAGTISGVYRSTNNGAHWSQLKGLMPTERILGLVRDSSGILSAVTNSNVYRSSDNGYSWNSFGLEDKGLSSISTHSRTFVMAGATGALYVFLPGSYYWDYYAYDNISLRTVFTALAEQNGVICVGTSDAGVFLSYDAGKTMTPVLGLPCSSINSIETKALSGDTGAIAVWAGTSCGLYYWTTSNPVWTEVGGPLSGHSVNSVKLIDSTLFAGTNGFGIFRTYDGVNWTEVYNGMENNTINAIEDAPNGSIFCGTLHGVQRSENNGDRWESVSTGIRATSINASVVNPKGYLFASTRTGIYRSIDRGTTWQEKNYLLTDRDVLCFAIGPDSSIWIGTRSGKLFNSTDDGESWEERVLLPNSPVESIMLIPNGRIFVGTSGELGALRISTSGLDSWYVPFEASVIAIERNDSIIYVLTSDYGLYRSSDWGEHWNNIRNNQKENSIAINSHGKIALGGSTFTNISSDNGKTWTMGSYTICTYIKAMMLEDNGNLIIGTGCGVFRSVDNGRIWLYDRMGLPHRQITTFSKYPDKMLVAGTDGSGIFLRENTSASTTVNELEDNVSRLSIHVTVSTGEIMFAVYKQGRYTVMLYDLLGQRVTTIADREFESGNHKLEYSFNGLTPGAYLLRAIGEGGVATTRVVVKW